MWGGGSAARVTAYRVIGSGGLRGRIAVFLVLTGKGEKTREKGGLPPGTLIYPDLARVVDFILKAPVEMSV